MPLRAMSFCRIMMITPAYVLLCCYQFHMGWIDTAMIPAKMVNLQAFRNGANKKFIGKSVRLHPMAIEPETAITFPVNIACPVPATVILNFNLLPEAD